MRALGELSWVELKLFLREPLTVVFVLVLPLVMLFVLNGVFGNESDPTVWQGIGPVDFYTPSYVALVTATMGVVALPVHLADYREQGILRRFRASALPVGALFGAQVAVAAVASVAGAVLVVTLSVLGYDAAWPRDWPGVLVAFVLMTLSFAALGALLGFVLPTARAAQGLGILLFFVFMMLGGAGPPREVLPRSLQLLGDATPVTYAGRLIRGPWLGTGWDLTAGVVVIAVGVCCTGLVLWRVRGSSA